MTTKHKPVYQFEPDGAFTITHYNRAAPFSSFLPGIGGAWGIPMWVFYVNRGQGVCSFGVRDKDHSISEFLPANWAYQLAFRQGFQTFIKIRQDRASKHYEPFQMAAARDPGTVQTMTVRPHEVAVRETSRTAGLEVEVSYFTLPQEPLTALVRTVRVRNLTDKSMSIQLLDGLPMIVPHGLDNFMLKNLRYIAQSQAEVIGLAERTPGFRTKATTGDTALVEEIRGVNFCFGYADGEPNPLLQPIVDPGAVYGAGTDLSYPEAFMDAETFRAPASQLTENQFASALLLADFELRAGQEKIFHSFFGYAHSPEELARFVQRARDTEFVSRKRLENRRLTERLTQGAATVSSHDVFNAYARQNLLDNVMRGGMPTTLRGGKNPVVLSLFARKHGDLERDYNFFIIEPTYCSQGESNYRDVNQNRRHDVFLNPDVGADHIMFFMNMIQADGFNPLLVRPKKFVCRSGRALTTFIEKAVGRTRTPAVLKQITRDFELGRLLTKLEEKGVALRIPRDEFVQGLLEYVQGVESSDFGHGYWTDHWTYNMDLIESFRGIHPEQMQDLLFRRNDFVYGDSHMRVKPRSEKYVLCNGSPMQLDSLVSDAEKKALIEDRKTRPHAMRTKQGRGEIYRSTLAPRLLALAAVKLASLDPYGVGVEMEAEKPNWYDALNGLPGQFGSSICETFELKRLLLLLKEAMSLAPAGFEWKLPVETAALVRGLSGLLVRRSKAYAFWDKAATLKETFRAAIRLGFDGEEESFSAAEVTAFLDRALVKVNAGIAAGRDRKTGLYHTYFRHEVTGFSVGPQSGKYATIRPKGFRQVRMPLFLEGQVHALRIEKDPRRARELVRAVKQSGLFDRTLNMYKVNANLDREPIVIGRARTFARGWLENESIWLHMEYKFLLEMLRAGLCQEFFEDFRHAAIPFLKPDVYGRSPTENSSFLVSEAYPDKSLVGKGFMARLSGATAEFIHMWLAMCAGERPFRVNAAGALEAELCPSLPAWLFTTKASKLELTDRDEKPFTVRVPAGAFAFVLLGGTVVTYVQTGGARDTFGPNAARIVSLRLVYLNGTEVELSRPTIPEPYATALRNGEIRTIEAQLK